MKAHITLPAYFIPLLFSTLSIAGCGSQKPQAPHRPIDGNWRVTEVQCGVKQEPVESALTTLYSEPFELIYSIDKDSADIQGLRTPAHFDLTFTSPGRFTYRASMEGIPQEKLNCREMDCFGTYVLNGDKLVLKLAKDDLFCAKGKDAKDEEKSSTITFTKYSRQNQNLLESAPQGKLEGAWKTHPYCSHCTIEDISIQSTGEVIRGGETPSRVGSFVTAKNDLFGLTLEKPLKKLSPGNVIVRFMDETQTRLELKQGEKFLILNRVASP